MEKLFMANKRDIKAVAKRLNPSCPELEERNAQNKIYHTQLELKRLELGRIDYMSYPERAINEFLEIAEEYYKSLCKQMLEIAKSIKRRYDE